MKIPPHEDVRLESRLHAVVLARPLAKAVALAATGGVLVVVGGWPLSVPGALAVAAGALVALRAVWRWERTRVVATSERLLLVHGTLRRRTTSVALSGGAAVAVERTVLGRLLGYGTLSVGDLELEHVPDVRRASAVVERLASPAARGHGSHASGRQVRGSDPRTVS